jgi:hypothetical protein
MMWIPERAGGRGDQHRPWRYGGGRGRRAAGQSGPPPGPWTSSSEASSSPRLPAVALSAPAICCLLLLLPLLPRLVVVAVAALEHARSGFLCSRVVQTFFLSLLLGSLLPSILARFNEHIIEPSGPFLSKLSPIVYGTRLTIPACDATLGPRPVRPISNHSSSLLGPSTVSDPQSHHGGMEQIGGNTHLSFGIAIIFFISFSDVATSFWWWC